jgi:hypothetical protein
MRYNRLEYLVKWKSYDESHNQWEEHTQLHAKLKIAQFHRKHPDSPPVHMYSLTSPLYHFQGPYL